MDIRRLDLNLLVLLDALFDEGSVSVAARRLKISQPAASFALAKLRDVFADELFVRGAAGMIPTPRAEALRAPVRRTLEIVRGEILPAQGFNPEAPRLTFTFCLSDVGEMTFLPDIVARLRAVAPHADVVSVSMPPAELAAALERGAVDLAIGYFPDLRAGIRQQALFDHSFTCLARRGNPWTLGGLSLEAFLAADHLVVAQEGRSQEIFERVLQERGFQRRVVIRTPHFMSAPRIIAQSDLLATVPRAVGVAWGRQLDVELLSPPFPVPAIPLKQFWHQRFEAEPRSRWIRSLVASISMHADPT